MTTITEIMEHIKVLIIGSSDMYGNGSEYNLPENVIDISFPCEAYAPIDTLTEKCKNCAYGKIDHAKRYPIIPLNGKRLLNERTYFGKKCFTKTEYSDLWNCKYMVFEQVKKIFGEFIAISYHTITPSYSNNLEYLPTINKINKIIENQIGLKGTINYVEPYNFSCTLDQIHKQQNYKNTKYDCIFIIGCAISIMYEPKNFRIIENLLNNSSRTNFVCNIDQCINKKGLQLKIISPINNIINITSMSVLYNIGINFRKAFTNYYDILSSTNFIEIDEILIKYKKNQKNKNHIRHKKGKKS